MVLVLLTAVFCGAVGASEPLEGCKWLADRRRPEPRPLGGILGRGQDGDGRYVLSSVVEESFSRCNSDGFRTAVAPDGVIIHVESIHVMGNRASDAKELNEGRQLIFCYGIISSLLKQPNRWN